MRFSTLALGLLATVGATAVSILPRDELDFDAYRTQALQPEHIQELWKGVRQHIDLLLPGIECSLADDAAGNSTISASLMSVRSDYCTALESELEHMFPSIRCHGDLDLDAYILTNHTASAHVLESRANNPVIQADESTDKAKANAKVSSFVSSCAGATHPGNCRACAIAFGASAVAEIGVCAAAAYAAMASTAGIATPAVVAGMSSCGVAALTGLFANINGCWTR